MGKERANTRVKTTRARLLKAAAEVFAARGYESATIRQICARAGANVALVTFYFGDKLELYTEVLRCAMNSEPPEKAFHLSRSGAEPEAALRGIIGALLERALEKGGQTNWRFSLLL